MGERVIFHFLFPILLLTPSGLAKESNLDWFSLIPSEFSREASDLIAHPTFIRHPPTQTVSIRPELYSYLLRDWELAGRLAKILDLEGYGVTDRGSGWFVRFNPRFFVEVVPLVHDSSRSIFLVKGEYQGRWVRSLHGRGVFLIVREPIPDPSPVETKTRVHAYVRVDQFLMGLLTKISMPFVGRRLDERLNGILRDLQGTSHKIRQNPQDALRKIQASPLLSEKEKEMLLHQISLGLLELNPALQTVIKNPQEFVQEDSKESYSSFEVNPSFDIDRG